MNYKLGRLLGGLCLGLAVLCAAPASAATINYSLTSGTVAVSFALPSNPVGSAGGVFAVTGAVTINGTTYNGSSLDFSATGSGPALEIAAGPYDWTLTGTQLFSGTSATPTLLTFSNLSLTNGGGPQPAGSTTIYLLNATTASNATPEPSTMLGLGSGFLFLMGVTVRRKYWAGHRA